MYAAVPPPRFRIKLHGWLTPGHPDPPQQLVKFADVVARERPQRGRHVP